MPCFNPVECWQLDTGEIRFTERGRIRRALKLRCGQCVGCRQDRSREWAARIMHESQSHSSSWFATLTYDDAHVPDHGNLRYRDYQLFMYRLRKKFGPVRFYMAGEYGSKTFRPHYHACLFGIDFPDIQTDRKSPAGHQLWKSAEFSSCWKLGYANFGALTFESAAYTARYVCKKVTGQPAAAHYRRVDPVTGEIINLTPEFSRMSLRPGIGRNWFDKYRADAFPHDFVIINGSKCRVPKYYSQLLKLQAPFSFDEIEHDRCLKSDSTASERTPERLAVREAVAVAGLQFKKRTL